MAEYIVYKGEKFWLQSSGRYFSSGDKQAKERMLHRRVWLDAKGEIPKGFHIHHINDNWRDNSIENLALVEGKEHARQHKLKRLQNREHVVQNAEWLEDARIAAAKWHKSTEGLAWHKKHGKNTWLNREPTDAICICCGKKYKTFFPSRSKYCSLACQQKQGFSRYFTDKKICEYCGKEFMANRHRTTKFCSRTCSCKSRSKK